MEIFKEFVGGRSFYSSEELTLKKDSIYYYSSWYHGGGANTVNDTGQWNLVDSLLILHSGEPQQIKRRFAYSKKERRKLKIKDRYYEEISSAYQFENDTFLYKDSVVYLFDFNELKNEEDSSFYFRYLTLHEKAK